MTLELERTGPTVDAAVIDAFEQRLGAQLPADYRHFLLTVNGGWAADSYHHPPSGPGDIGIRALWGVGIDDVNSSMERNLAVFADRYPSDFLPIGEDSGGNLILIQISGDDVGSIHFWDHEEEADEDEPPTHRNITRISDSFTAFLEELEVYELDEEDLAWIAEYRRKRGLE